MQTVKQYFTFPEIDLAGEFSFEKLSAENFPQLYLLFENDDSPFTEECFKKYDGAKKYTESLEKYGRTSPKHGSQDWLFKWNGKYAGVLHLYDLSLETFGENNKRCWISFAITPALRRKGFTQKALSYFLQYTWNNYPEIKYIHSMTLKGNIAAQNLLSAAGFDKDEEERHSKMHYFYLLKK